MLWDKKSNLMLEAFTSDITSTDSIYCIYYPEHTEATFSITSFSVPDDSEIAGSYAYYFPNKSIEAHTYAEFNIKIRQTFGKEFTFVVFYSIDTAGGKIQIGPYNNSTFYENMNYKEGQQWLNNKDNKYYSMKAGEIYMYIGRLHWDSSTKKYLSDSFLYDYSSKKNMYYVVNYPVFDVIENPMNISNKIPGLCINNSIGTVSFYGLRAYSCFLSDSEILECLNASIYFTKSSSQLRAKKFNEYCSTSGSITIENDEHTHDYTHPTFYKDGTVFCTGQLIEGAINQVCKNGDIKSQEFIEYQLT